MKTSQLPMTHVVDAPPPQVNEAIHNASHGTSATESSNTVEEKPTEAKNNNDGSVNKEGVVAEVYMKGDGNDTTADRKDMGWRRRQIIKKHYGDR